MTTKRNAAWHLRLGPPRGGGGRQGASITWAGIIYFLALAVLTLAALNASVNLLFLVIGFGVGVGIISVIIADASVRKLRLTREAPDAVVAGRPFTIRYRLSNIRTRGATFALRIRDTVRYGDERLKIEGYIDAVPAGDTVALEIAACVPLRGRLEFTSVRVSTRFPFGLLERRSTVAAAHETAVFPQLFPLRRTIEGRRALAAAQFRAVREQHRGSDEFYGLREYRHGDSPKRVHWRRTARTGQLLVREMTDMRPQSVIVILDTFLPPGLDESQRELAISAAATILCHALERGYRLALIVSSAHPVVISPTSGRGLRARLLSQLAQIDGPPTVSAARFLERLRWRGNWRGRCLLIAPIAHEGVWESANYVRRHVGAVEVITASGPEFASWFGPGVGNSAELSAREAPAEAAR